MKAVDFAESNFKLTAPQGMEDKVFDLNVWKGHYTDGNPAVISVWELSTDDLLKIIDSGKIYLSFLGHNHPPVCPMIESPFCVDKQQAELPESQDDATND